MKRRARCDVVILGGGVAGLWTRARLERAGLQVVLLESEALGAGQTAASQGILHRGVKYAFSAQARGASDQLAQAQNVWRDALAGRGPVDLSSIEVLATDMHLWSVGLLGKATGRAAALAMKSEVRKLDPGDYPPAFAAAPPTVAVWRVDETSVFVPSLTERLHAAARGPVLKIASTHRAVPVIKDSAALVQVHAESAGADLVEIEASAAVLAAGAGNEALLSSLGVNAMTHAQRRPLHMVLMDAAPFPLFAHCPRAGSDKPRLTVTSVRSASGWCWSIGGDVAETGVDRPREAQIDFARREIRECLGWLDVSRARWAAYRIDRAEGRTPAGRRPDGAVVRRPNGPASRVIAVWPTKLALAPVAADLVAQELAEIPVNQAESRLAELDGLPAPFVSPPPAAWKDLTWS